MKPQTKIYIAMTVAAVIAAGVLGGHLLSSRKTAKLEAAADEAKQAAEASRRIAERSEIAAAEYRQKNDYLEGQLTELRSIARRQDEELEKLSVNRTRVRADAGRARNTRTIAATADELCAKLAGLGHACR